MPLIRKPASAPAAPAAPDAAAAAAGLRSSQADVRWAAARALSAFPAFAGPLGDAAAAEPDPRVREAMFTSLARIGTPRSIAFLVAHLRTDDPERRTAAMDTLRTLPAALGAVMPGLLADQDADVRLLACDLARELPPTEAMTLLVEVLDNEPQLNVCAGAVDVLAEVGAPGAAPALRRCAARFGDPFLDFAVKVAVERLGEQAPPRG